MDPTITRGVSVVLFAYFLGSIPFGIIVAHLFDRGVNLRSVGSGNIGATNVARAVGRAGGVLTLLLDAGKGILAMVLAVQFIPGRVDHWIALAGGAAFLGHVFSIYLHFKGGKGVATALGIVFFLSPVTAFILVVVFAGVVYFTRYVSLGSLCAAALSPFLMALLASSRHDVTLSLVMTVVLFHTHRENIRRLLAGGESRFGERAGREPAGPPSP